MMSRLGLVARALGLVAVGARNSLACRALGHVPDERFPLVLCGRCGARL